MRGGKFDKRITFERVVGIDDGFDHKPGAWVADPHVWARLLETSASEAIAAGRVEARTTARLRVRNLGLNKSITELHRVVNHLGRVWNIAVARRNQIADHPMESFDIIRQRGKVNGHGQNYNIFSCG